MTDIETKFENHKTKLQELTTSLNKEVYQDEFDKHKKLFTKLQEYVMTQQNET